MTFSDAAIEILKRKGKPCHFKDLARLAVEYNLLTVIGRDPERTMGVQLQSVVNYKSSPLVLINPGVYGLRFYPRMKARWLTPVWI